MKIGLVYARAANGVIGKDGVMPWHLPEDMAHFRQVTMGAPVVMGRKTWDSIGRPLPGRRNIVITRNPQWHADGTERASSLTSALDLARNESKVFVIGGGEIYAQALPLADELVLTEIDADFDADTFFPAWDRAQFSAEASEPQTSENGHRYRWVIYRRKQGA